MGVGLGLRGIPAVGGLECTEGPGRWACQSYMVPTCEESLLTRAENLPDGGEAVAGEDLGPQTGLPFKAPCIAGRPTARQCVHPTRC